MAQIALIAPDEQGVTAAAMTATAVGGDTFVCPNDGSDYVFFFRNDHTSGVDVSLVAVQTTQVIPGVGRVTKGNLTRTVAPNGGVCAFKLSKADIAPYLNSGVVGFQYASHNVALKVVAMKVPPV